MRLHRQESLPWTYLTNSACLLVEAKMIAFMGVGRIFFKGATRRFFQNFSMGEAKVVKFVFSSSKLTFFCWNFQNPGVTLTLPAPFPRPWLSSFWEKVSGTVLYVVTQLYYMIFSLKCGNDNDLITILYVTGFLSSSDPSFAWTRACRFCTVWLNTRFVLVRVSAFTRDGEFLRHILSAKDGIIMPAYVSIPPQGSQLILSEFGSRQIKLFFFWQAPMSFKTSCQLVFELCGTIKWYRA